MPDWEKTRIVCAAKYRTRWEAEMAESLLESNGVRAFVVADDCGGMREHLLNVTGDVRLLVNELDVEKARRVLRDIRGDVV